MPPILQKKKIQTKILQWFKKNRRDLPWRKTRDPYCIWVSEIMLQQTQVATVIPYYQNFLKQFPTVHHLAKANLSAVLKVWEGLGYYSRARNLHQASRIVLNHLKGKIPDTLEGLLALPGIGRSTAGAILSFAYDKKAPILDGNVRRVLSRLFAITKSEEKSFWDLSESLIPEGCANPFNQALMDLGSMVCTPKDPQCSRCPLHAHCKARASGNPHRYPFKATKKKIPHVEGVAAVIVKGGRVLLNQRPPRGLLGGLWEFPNWPTQGKKDLESFLRKKVKSKMGITVKSNGPLGLFKQTFSHFKLTLHVYRGHRLEGESAGRWVPLRDLSLFPMSRIHRKIAETIA